MRKTIFVCFVCFTIIFTVCSCQTEGDPSEKTTDIKEELINIESYSCGAKIKVASNNGSNDYYVNIAWQKDGRYRIKTEQPKILTGNIILFDGKGLWQYNTNVESKISIVGANPDFEGKNKVFISEFMKNYLNGSNSTQNEIFKDGKNYLVLSAEPNYGKYFAKQTLWIDSNEKVPVKLETYNDENKPIFIAEFFDFKFNEKFSEDIFDISKY